MRWGFVNPLFPFAPSLLHLTMADRQTRQEREKREEDSNNRIGLDRIGDEMGRVGRRCCPSTISPLLGRPQTEMGTGGTAWATVL